MHLKRGGIGALIGQHTHMHARTHAAPTHTHSIYSIHNIASKIYIYIYIPMELHPICLTAIQFLEAIGKTDLDSTPYSAALERALFHHHCDFPKLHTAYQIPKF